VAASGPNHQADELLAASRQAVGSARCLTDAASRAVYARDSSHLSLGRPLAVVLPRTDEQVAAVVAACADHDVPFVVRGSGTGLSGGAVPGDGAVVISVVQLDDLGPVDVLDRRVRVGVGVLNDRVSSHAAPFGLHFAPDPSSQSASTIGGNIAENAGGPHCLKVGVTLQHLLRLEWLDAGGRRWTTGRGLVCERGIDLLGLLTGSEGTLGLVTHADLKLTPDPVETATLLAVFPRLDEATTAVIDLLGGGLMPVAVEMVDQPVLEVVEAAFGFGFPTDVEAAMIVEFAGGGEAVAEDADRAQRRLLAGGAREVRLAADEHERLELWRCRKKAFGAVGRISPCYVTMDVVVPLGRLPDLVTAIGRIKREHGVKVATAFHAGDGNLHPGVMYDDRDEASTRRAHAAADHIIETALAMGGSVTGEHGVGIEKRHVIGQQLEATAAGLMTGIKELFDPRDLCNPGKLVPPAGTTYSGGRSLPSQPHYRWDSLTVTAPATTPLAEIQATALARGFWVPVGLGLRRAGRGDAGAEDAALTEDAVGTVGDAVANLLPGPTVLGTGTARDFLLELWGETGDGRAFHTGAPVFKNVAGYDLPHLLCGSGRLLARPLGATLQLRPAPETVAWWRFRAAAFDRRCLEPLLAELGRWDGARSGAACLGELTTSTATLTVLAAGRDRAWDLDRKNDALLAWARQWGLTTRDGARLPCREAVNLLASDAIPGWAGQGADWTLACRLIDTPHDEPLPPPVTRFVWNAAPRLVWLPALVRDAAPGWFFDPFLRGGVVTPPPPPAPSVPRSVLAGLKALFDPGDSLDTPDWLRAAATTGDSIATRVSTPRGAPDA